MRKSRIIKGSQSVMEARRILQASKQFIVLSDAGDGNVRLHAYGYGTDQVAMVLAKVLLGLRLLQREGVPEAAPEAAPESEMPLAAPHLYAPGEPPPTFAPDGRHESEAASDG